MKRLRYCLTLLVAAACLATTPEASNAQVEYLEMVKLTSPDIGGGDHFGDQVAIDGDTVAIGVPDIVGGAGAIYIYERNAGGSNAWGLATSRGAWTGRGTRLPGNLTLVSGRNVHTKNCYG